MDDGVPRSQADSTQAAPERPSGELHRRGLDARRMGSSIDRPFCREHSPGNCGAANVRTRATGAENTRRSPEFSILRPHGLRLAVGGSVAWGRRGALGFIWRDLGRFPACADGRIHRRDGLLRWPAHSACVRGDAAIVEYPADVRRTCAPHNWMYSSRFQRGSRISGICQLGVVRIAGVGAARIGGDHGLRHEYFGTFILEPSHVQKQSPLIGINTVK